jgi:hypothetical protein
LVLASLVAAGVGVVFGLLGTYVGFSTWGAVRNGITGGLIALGVAAYRFYRSPVEVESWRHDAEAERRTARALDRLSRAGYTVLHDRVLPDSAGNIDHLVLGPSGAWVIESDAHRGPLRQDRAGLWAGRVPLRAELALIQWMGDEITSQLVDDLPEGWQLEVQPVVSFTRAELPQGLALLDGVVLLAATDIASYILSAGVVLKPLDVAVLVDAAERIFPPYPVQGEPPSRPGLARLRGLLGR